MYLSFAIYLNLIFIRSEKKNHYINLYILITYCCIYIYIMYMYMYMYLEYFH